MIQILVLKTEYKVIYNKSNLNCKTFFEEFIYSLLEWGPNYFYFIATACFHIPTRALVILISLLTLHPNFNFTF